MEGRQSKNWVAMSYTHIFLIDILQVSQHTLAFSQARWEGKGMLQNLRGRGRVGEGGRERGWVGGREGGRERWWVGRERGWLLSG